MRKINVCILFICFLFIGQVAKGQVKSTDIVIYSNGNNDIGTILKANNYSFKSFKSQMEAVNAAKKGGGILFIANGYPKQRLTFDKGVEKVIAKKKLKVFIEYPDVSTKLMVGTDTIKTQLERGVVNTSKIKGLDSLDLIGIHNAYVIKSDAKNPILIVAKVAGFDNAQYGISDVPPTPLLFKQGNTLVATTRLSHLITSRFGPVDHLKGVMEYIFSYLSPQVKWEFANWPLQVKPMHNATEALTKQDYQKAIKKGTDWFSKGNFFVHPSWEPLFLKRQGDGLDVAGPPLDLKLPVGNGSLGVLEGHLSRIQADGTQIYRYWMRADCNAEVAFAMSMLKDPASKTIAKNLLDYIFKNSNLRGGPRNDPKSPLYGLVGWATTHPFVYYGDDNARVILGAMGASALMNDGSWDKYIAENIIANFRTTGKNGFRGGHLRDKGIIDGGLKQISEKDLINPHPHFESWMWATYLWLYDKTGYKPFLDLSKKAIAITMEKYPKWKWTNGIQQERARMILPLAWLVRVEDTPQHRKWLSTIADRLLENVDASGAIREELGDAKDGRYGATKTNADYGKHEAPLIAVNGDPVADMLYTTNFGFFALNEAAAATGDAKYKDAVKKIADFLVRIQVQSDVHPDLDGAWFRAFDYKRWEYWASNADAGWGAWGTLTGWTQSWIVSTLAMHTESKNLWDISKDSKIKAPAEQAIKEMLNDNKLVAGKKK
jgi:hypothetical protein